MAQFPGITLTNAGLNMIAESQASSTALIFTNLKMGDGNLTAGEDIKTLTAVKNPMLTAAIQSYTNQGDGQVKLRFTISNGTLTTGFFAREIGIYAKVGASGTEQLYAYTNAGNLTDYIPDKYTPIDEQIIDIYLVVGNASSVQIVTDSSIMYVTMTDLNEHKASTTVHAEAFNAHNTASSAHSLMMQFWQASYAYAVGDCIRPKIHGSYKYLECTVAGTSGTSEPTWPAGGSTVTDGGVTWKVCDMRHGTTVGKLLEVIDVGGAPGLPAISGKLLTDIAKGFTARNAVVNGPIDASSSPAFLYSDKSNGNITLKASTMLNFAAGIADTGPMDYVEKVVSDIVSSSLAAAGVDTIPVNYTADVCNGGTAISGGDSSGKPASNAFANDNSTTWWTSSQTAVNGVAYIGYNFGAGVTRAIRKISLNQDGSTACVTSVKVQYSSDGITWNTAATVTIAAGVNYITVPGIGAYQYWRLLANSATLSASSWMVNEIEMYEAYQTHHVFADRSAPGVIGLVSSKNKPRTGKLTANVVNNSGYYTADLCVGGTPISSGDWSTYTKDKAFDNNTGTAWIPSLGANSGAVSGAWIGYNFSTAKSIKQVVLSQLDGNIGSVSSVVVEYSTDNGATWNAAGTFSVGLGVNTLTIAGNFSATQWRVRANSNTITTGSTSSWDVNELEMMEYVAPSSITVDDTIYTDNICVGGAAISSGDYSASGAKEYAFDNNTSTTWVSQQVDTGVSGAAYIGYSFGNSTKKIRRVVITQADFSTSHGVNTVKIQRTIDGSTWQDVATATLQNGKNYIDLPDNAGGIAWRVLATANPANSGTYSWYVYEITMHELSIDMYYYDPYLGVMRHWDGTSWTVVQRVYLGSVDVDTTGKIVSWTSEQYNLARLEIRNAELPTEPVALGQMPKYALINETQPSGTAGGTFTSGAWRTRTLNTIVNDNIGITLSNNQITLPAGTYEVDISVPAYSVAGHKARLLNITDGSTPLVGTSEYSYTTNSCTTRSLINGSFTIPSAKVFEVQHYCNSTDSAGFGNPVSAGGIEIYTQVQIRKVK